MSKEKYIFQVPPTLYGELKELKYKADKYDKYKEVLDKLQQKNKQLREVIDKATNELFILKDMIYKPETREENFEIQRKISSIIKRLNGKEVE